MVRTIFFPDAARAAQRRIGGASVRGVDGNLTRSHIEAPSVQRRISFTKKKEDHHASRVSHFDEENDTIEEEEKSRTADEERRRELAGKLFGENAEPLSEEEAVAIHSGQLFCVEVSRNLRPMPNSNKLVKLWATTREDGGVLLKASVSVRARPRTVAAFLYDFVSDLPPFPLPPPSPLTGERTLRSRRTPTTLRVRLSTT